MASFAYDSFWFDGLSGNINVSADSFKILLVTAAYTPSKGTHTKRSDITNEVSGGAGYTAGGQAITLTLAKNGTTHVISVTPAASTTWPAATITAAAAVIYKSRGGGAAADELVGYIDDLGTFSSSAGDFIQQITGPFSIQN
jgi:hypothetical protein